jgi:hypothetical protein
MYTYITEHTVDELVCIIENNKLINVHLTSFKDGEQELKITKISPFSSHSKVSLLSSFKTENELKAFLLGYIEANR